MRCVKEKEEERKKETGGGNKKNLKNLLMNKKKKKGEDGHAYDVLQNAQLDQSLLTKYKIPAELHADLLSIVRHRMSSNPVKVRKKKGGCFLVFFFFFFHRQQQQG